MIRWISKWGETKNVKKSWNFIRGIKLQEKFVVIEKEKFVLNDGRKVKLWDDVERTSFEAELIAIKEALKINLINQLICKCSIYRTFGKNRNIFGLFRFKKRLKRIGKYVFQGRQSCWDF